VATVLALDFVPARVGRRRPPLVLALAILLGVAAVVGIVVFAVVQAAGGGSGTSQKDKAEALVKEDTPGLPGTFYPSQGNDHLSAGTVYPICSETITEKCYKSNPPTSGPHDPRAVPWGVQTAPVAKERLVHNMEHAGVVIWYNTSDESVIDGLKKAIADEAKRNRKLVVMVPYPDMEPDTVALTAWTRLDKFPTSDFSPDRVKTFIERLERRYNPEGIEEP